jgi:Ca2+-binding RTX toxin-like protein
VTITVNPIEDLILIGDSNNNILEAGKGNDRLEGRAGRDILIGGAGDDILVGGSGGDTLTGGTGSDTFVYQAVTDLGDTITDFKPSEGDKLDLSQLLAGSLYSNDTNPLNAYVRITPVSGGTAVQIDPNGDLAPSVFVTLTTLQGFTGNLGAESFII